MIKLNTAAIGIIFLGLVAFLVWTSENMATSNPPDGKIHVTYWETWTAFEFDAMKAIVDDFNASQSRVHVDILSTADIENKTMMSISAGVPPDVAGLMAADVAHFSDDHALMPLDDFCRSTNIKGADYIPVYWDMGSYNGHVWTLPSVPSSTGLFYNRKLLGEAGLPEEPPKTIEDLDRYDKAITKIEDGRLKVAGYIPVEPGWWNWAYGYYFGGRLIDNAGRLTAYSSENVKALDWLANFSKRDGASALQSFKQGFGNFSSPQNAFMDGEVAMEIQGVWMDNFIHKFRPDLDWWVGPFPHPETRPDLANVTMVDENVLGIPVGARHPKEAFEFIAFVQTQKEMEKLCSGQWKYSPLQSVSDGFWKGNPNPTAKFFYDISKSPNAVPPPKLGDWPEYQDELNSAIDGVTLLTQTPDEALKHAQEQMEPKYAQYRERLEERRVAGL